MTIECLNLSSSNITLDTHEANQLLTQAKNNNPVAQHRLGSWYLTQGTQEHFTTGCKLIEQAAVNGNAESQCILGDIGMMSLHKNPEHYDTSANWYLMAADSGFAEGQAKIAYLYLTGIGVAQNHKRAFFYYQKLAEQKSPGSLSNLAYMYSHGIGIGKDETMANTWYRLAALNNEPRAYNSLGLRYLCGHTVTVDHLKGLAFIQRAAALGYPGSKDLSDGLTGILNEEQRIQLLELQSTIDSYLEKDPNTALINNTGIKLNTEILQGMYAHSETEVVCWKPRVFKIQNFLSHDECDHLVDIARHNARHSEASSSKGFKGNLHDGLTTFLISPICDATIYNIEHRIEKTTWYPADYGARMSILRFQEGNKYPDHVDYFKEDSPDFDSLRARWGQRDITFLIYLNKVEEGGETAYIRTAGKTITPEKGMAAMHFNCLPTGNIDEHSVHAGLPIRKGEKWLLRKAICRRSQYAAAASRPEETP